MGKEKKLLRKIKKIVKINSEALNALIVPEKDELRCIADCQNKNVRLYYCSTCDKSYPVCKSHFNQRQKSQICLACGEKSIKRRWTMPVP